MLSDRCLLRLAGVHPALVRVVTRARLLSPFIVVEGVRSLERQRELFAAGATRTLNSRHLTGHAVDVAPLVGKEVRWDWPLYRKLAIIVKESAAVEKVAIVWGGDWKTFLDGPHFELARSAYP